MYKRQLKNLSTFDLFGFSAADIHTPEQMPELRWFWMTSLPETAAKAAKQLWKGKPGMDLRITKPVSYTHLSIGTVAG